MRLNLIAPINQLGFGQFSTGLFKAALSAGAEVSLWPVGPVECRKQDEALVQEGLARAASFANDAPCLRIWHPFDMAQSVGRGLRCGYTFFETTVLRPVEKHNLASLDRIFVSSAWAKRVLVDNGLDGEAIRVAPPGVDTSIFRPDVPKAALPKPAGPNTTVFLTCGKFEYRKGHCFAAQAFNAAFEPNDDVLLVYNSYNPCLPAEKSREWEQYFAQTKMGRAGRIYCVPERLPTQDHVASLMAASDCGFYPARSEGWGMETTEMMAMGKPVITTNYSAHTEYATQETAYLVDIDGHETAYDGIWFKGDVGEWAMLGDKALSHSVEHLRSVHRQKRSGPLPINAFGLTTFTERLTWPHCFSLVAKGMT